MTAVMGVDPGTRGGLAVVGERGPLYVTAFDPGMTQKALVAVVRHGADVLTKAGGRTCFMEKVGYMPGDGGKGANTFGRVDGILRGAVLMYAELREAGLDVKDVAPVMWQMRMECLTGGNKNVSKNRAIALFPGIPRITHATADALLIAEYGRRTLEAS